MAHKILLVFISLACVIVPRVYTQSAVRYILPSDEEVTSDCPVSDSNQCITLSQLINSTRYESDIHYKFIGSHYDLEGVLRIMDTENITLSSMGEDVPIIECSAGLVNSGLVVMNVTVFRMQDISLLGCHVEMIQEELMIDRYATTFLNFSLPLTAGVYLNYLHDVSLINVNIRNSTRYGILAFNLLGHSLIKSTRISDSNRASYGNFDCAKNLGFHCKGGNFALVYTDLLHCPNKEVRYSLTITESMFINGVDGGVSFAAFVTDTTLTRADVQFVAGSGLGVQLMQSSYGMDIVIENCTIDNNAGFVGANLNLGVWDFVDNSTILVKDSTITHGSNPQISSLEILESSLGSGFHYEIGILLIIDYNQVCEAEKKYETEVFTMENCLVANNIGLLATATIVESANSFSQHLKEVVLKGVRFIENNGDATLVLQGEGLIPSGFKNYIIECEFTGNFFRIPNNIILGSSNHQIVYQISVLYVEYVNCTWRDNKESSLHAVQSRLIFTGENRFINNTGVNGGGLEMQEGSELFLQSGSKTVFIGNHARMFGGAIYASMLSYRCFFQLDTSKDLPEMSFYNNSASMAGDAVYGNLRRCVIEGRNSQSKHLLNLFYTISTFSFISQESSNISGDPLIICGCSGGIVNCSSSEITSGAFYNVHSSPGKDFTVQIEAFSFYDGLNVGGQTTAEVIPAVIETLIDVTIDANTSLISTAPQRIEKGCNEATFGVKGPVNTFVYLTLSPVSDRLYFPAFVRVSLDECPSGFVYSSGDLSCVCLPLFVDHKIKCNLQTNEFTKAFDSQWIGYIEGNDNEGMEIAVGICRAVQYCNDNLTKVILNGSIQLNNDSQCVNNHSGVLCGQCADGYSLALGSESKCLQCSNSYLALLIFFALAGPLWIAFLSVFDITVSSGRINGMLFYANVLRIANYEFFNYTNESAFYIFKIVINWINLDFGIVSCFYNGFDFYAKAWFNFAFPFYLFTILIIITVCANRFNKFSRVLPKNILSVLTTVILICFTKLLRSSFASMPYHRLETANGTMAVWYFDGNVKYFSLKHSILLMFAILVLLLLLIPYSLIMIFYPYLQSFTAHEDTVFERFVCFLRRIIFRFKPLLDTYDGALFSKYRYYTALQIILRPVILFIAVGAYTFASVDETSTWFKPASISMISLVLLVLVISKRIYLCPVNMTVEVIYLGNLVILHFILLILQFLDTDYDQQGIVVTLSIALSFISFICTLIHDKYTMYASQIYSFFGKKYKPNKLQRVEGRKMEEEMKRELDPDDQTMQIMQLIDDDRLNVKGRSKRGVNRPLEYKQQLIQNLINGPNDNGDQ